MIKHRAASANLPNNEIQNRTGWGAYTPWRSPHFHFATPGVDPAVEGGGVGDADPAVEPGEPKPGEMISRAEAVKAFAARDAAKRITALLTRELGIETGALKLVPTNDPADPFKLAPESLAMIKQIAKPSQGDETEHAKLVRLQDDFIGSRLVESELRQALASAGAVDSMGDGSYIDCVQLLKDKMKIQRTIGEDGKLNYSIIALDEKGQPLPDGGAKEVVASFLSKRPALVKAGRRAGPGAGGQSPSGNPTSDPKTRGGRAADYAFGQSGKSLADARAERSRAQGQAAVGGNSPAARAAGYAFGGVRR